jgi:hypothetical protein
VFSPFSFSLLAGACPGSEEEAVMLCCCGDRKSVRDSRENAVELRCHVALM